MIALLAIIPQTGGNSSLLPALQDRNLLLHVQALPGTSLTEMDRMTAAAGNELQTLPGVRSVGTHVGRAIGSDQLTNVNSAEVWITLDDRADYARTKAAITTVMHGYPGLRTTWSPTPVTESARRRPNSATTSLSASTAPT